MTSAQQKRFYFPVWNAVCRVHGWKSSLRDMDLVATRQPCWGAPDVDQLYRKVWVIALGLAEAEDRSFVVTDLRHACHLMVNPRRRHSGELNNKETNRVVHGLFGLLELDSDMDAMIAWDYPDQAAKVGLRKAIRKRAPLAYYTEVMRDKHHTDDLEQLTERELMQLLYTIKNRKPTFSKQIADQPF